MTPAVTHCRVREGITMNERKVMKLASRGKRFGAACIDMVIPAVSCFIAFIALAVMVATELAYSNYGYGFGTPGFGYGYGYSRGPSAGTVTALIISFLLNVAYLVIQMIFFNKSKTIGKAALGLQVVSSKDGTPIGFWKMLFREWIVKSASGSVFLLGFIWILIDDRNRGWHDKILDTYVVDLKESAALHSASADNARSVQRPSPKSAPAPVPAAVSQKPAPAAAEQTAVTSAEQPSGTELSGNVLDVADVVVETARRTAAESADKTEYDTVNARTDDLDEQK